MNENAMISAVNVEIERVALDAENLFRLPVVVSEVSDHRYSVEVGYAEYSLDHPNGSAAVSWRGCKWVARVTGSPTIAGDNMIYNLAQARYLVAVVECAMWIQEQLSRGWPRN